MDSKKQPTPNTTVTRDINQLSEETGNIYQTVMIIAQRANQGAYYNTGTARFC